jgi:hypothetical protein
MALFGKNALENRGKSTMLFQMPFAASLLGIHTFSRARSGAISLMISTKNRQECGVWVVLDLAGGTGGRGHAPR